MPDIRPGDIIFTKDKSIFGFDKYDVAIAVSDLEALEATSTGEIRLVPLLDLDVFSDDMRVFTMSVRWMNRALRCKVKPACLKLLHPRIHWIERALMFFRKQPIKNGAHLAQSVLYSVTQFTPFAKIGINTPAQLLAFCEESRSFMEAK